ncbi:hypothetical protein [Natrinema salaciae]|uniref:Uncharacterized protein n=1 Tax=Natrinema salaciae TaxID=1186196 RepID=A0A1H9AW42_9EURY|nr:hypothetical protein [Natrinema salaciae]SEP80966.1 hypothetical protein SAMN04489841_0564 [Natrinema salaciae]
MTSSLEALSPAVLGGGIDGPTVVAAVVVVAMVVTVGFFVFLALGPGTEPYQAEQAEPTPTDDSGLRNTDADERSGQSTESGSD